MKRAAKRADGCGKRKGGVRHICTILIMLLIGAFVISLSIRNGMAATPGLPFTEDFSTDNLKDGPGTNANWSPQEQKVYMAWRHAQQNAFGPDTTGTDITADFYTTRAIAFGDMDGDGDLDVVVGNYGDTNRLYLNNGTADPFNGVSGTDITAYVRGTTSIALGDVDGDGDLDMVTGNLSQVNRLYLNNGTADPFNGVSGTDITADFYMTRAIALGDVDGDGDLDLVVGNGNQKNRLYLNNGTAAPFNGVSGTDISADEHNTWAIALGDVDADGDLDVVAGNNGQANRLYLNNGTADPFNGVTGKDITTDVSYTWDIALGDMDADGDLDVVAGNYSQRSRLYLNNGTADPFNGVSGMDITADVRHVHCIALGDVDGDGDLDVVAGNEAQPNRLYLNNGTADPFNGVSGMDITTDARVAYGIALGDVDGDGDLDVVAGNEDETNRLYLNNSNADPFNGVSGTDITADAHRTIAIALGDVDGDGDLDVVEGSDNQTIRLYLNNGTLDPFNGVTGTDVSADLLMTYAIALGDVDGDGDLDVIAGNYNQKNVLYLNNGTADPFNGVTGKEITADVRFTYALALGDVDGDGDLDLVAGNYGSPSRLYLSNGTADPFNGVTGKDITADARYTYAIALGDADGDGDLDVVAGNASNQINRLYLNNGTADPFNGVSGKDITADAHNTQAIALGDVDGDGDLDVVAGNANQRNRLYLNNGSADPFNGVSGTDITGDIYATNAIALRDFDGDGDLDVVAGNYNQKDRLYLNNGTADPFNGVTGTNITADAYATNALALGDLDGDGDLDVVTGNYNQTNRLYLNNKTAYPFNGVTGTDITADVNNTSAIALGDVDGDGDLDVVVGNTLYQPSRLYLNNGTADPFNGVTGTDITSDVRYTYAIALGDVDGDGDLDVIAGNYNQRNRLYLNNGTADPFNGVTGTDITSDVYYTYAIALGDVDGDGDLDVVAANYEVFEGFEQANRLYLNNGTADPFNGVIGKDITADYHQTIAIALGDVDGDGDLDVVAGNYGQANRLYLNNGTADPFNGVTGKDITADVYNTYAIALGDVDGDGDLDVVAGNYGEANRLYLNNGTADPFNGVTGKDITADAHNTQAIALGDVDGDGDLDMVAGNYEQANRLYLNNGTADPFNGMTGKDITSDADSTLAMAVGDIDGDGDLDVVAGNYRQPTRLYRRELYDTGRGKVRSLAIDAETGNIANARLTPTATTPLNTRIDWYLTNNGGARWFQVPPGEYFVFPTSGSDLRWKAEMSSLSPHRTPAISQLLIETDTTSPSVAISDPAQDVATNQGSVTIKATADDDSDVASVTMTLDGGAPQLMTLVDGVYQAEATFGAEKSYSIVVRATDEVGNSSTATRNIIYDVTAPVTSSSLSEGTWLEAQGLTLSCEDGTGSGCDGAKYCKGSGCIPENDYTGIITISGSTDLRFFSTDNAGNIESVKTVSYTIQYTVTGISGGNGSVECASPVNSGTATTCTLTSDFGYHIKTTGGTCGGTLTDSTFTTSAVNYSCTVTADFARNLHKLTVNKTGTGVGTVGGGGTYGYNTTHQITAAASSGSIFTGWTGDCTGSSSPLSVTILDRDMTCTATFDDITPPNAPVVSGATPTNNTKPTWTWTTGGGGKGTYRYKRDNSDLTSGATQTTSATYTPTTALAAGSHTLYVQERDAAGNWSESGSSTIIIDRTPPDTTITGKPGNPTKNTSATLTFTSEAGVAFQCQLDSGGYAACTSPATYSTLTEGSHNFKVKATDAAGNTDPTPAAYTWKIDTTPPTLGTVKPTPITTEQGRTQIFSAIYSAQEGFVNLNKVEMLVNTAVAMSNGMRLAYDRPNNLLSLYNDAGTTSVGTCTPTAVGVTLSNSQGTLNCQQTTIKKLGNDITVNWSITPKLAFASTTAKKIYIKATDTAANTASFTPKGTWTILTANTKPTLVSLSPTAATSAAGVARTFTAVYSDANGFANLKAVELLATTAAYGGANSIWAKYDRSANLLRLYNNAGSSLLTTSCVPGAAGMTISNSQGSLNCQQTTVTKSGDNITVKWNITPAAVFTGEKTLKMRATDYSNTATGLVGKGTWTITAAAPALTAEDETFAVFKYGVRDNLPYSGMEETVLKSDSEDLVIEATEVVSGGEVTLAIKKKSGDVLPLTGNFIVMEQKNGAELFEYRFDGRGSVEVRQGGKLLERTSCHIEEDGALTIGMLKGQMRANGAMFVLSGGIDSPALVIGTKASQDAVEGLYEGAEMKEQENGPEILPVAEEVDPMDPSITNSDGDFVIKTETNTIDGSTAVRILKKK